MLRAFNQSERFIGFWAMIHLAIGYWAAVKLDKVEFIMPGAVLFAIALMSSFIPNVKSKIKIGYIYVLCLLSFTPLIEVISKNESLVFVHAAAVMIMAAFYLRYRLLWLVIGIYAVMAVFAYSFLDLWPAREWMIGITVMIMLISSVFWICYIAMQKINYIRESERKMSLQRVEQQEHLATIGQIAASIAHDIRNPLTSIRGFVQIMEKTERRDNYREYFKIIQGEIQHIESLIREVLLLSKSHTVDTASIEPVSLGNLLERLVTLLEPDAIRCNIELILEKKTDPLVSGSVEKLQQVFLNLLRNAFEAVNESGKIAICLETVEERAVVRIRDSGPGIPEKVLKLMFTPFYSTKENGTGLGLSICQSIIKAHEGVIKAENAEEGGALFTVELPLLKKVNGNVE